MGFGMYGKTGIFFRYSMSMNLGQIGLSKVKNQVPVLISLPFSVLMIWCASVMPFIDSISSMVQYFSSLFFMTPFELLRVA